jgi:hypothetical protein
METLRDRLGFTTVYLSCHLLPEIYRILQHLQSGSQCLLKSRTITSATFAQSHLLVALLFAII